MAELRLKDFPLKSYDKLRYGDTDRQGHVNNAVFSTFLETGRVEFLYHPDFAAHLVDVSFVVASIQLDLLREMTWPGRVDIGTGILKVGNSSISVWQCLFQNGLCVAKAKTVIVQVDDLKGGSKPMVEAAKKVLRTWLIA